MTLVKKMVAAVFKLTATIFILVVAVCYYSLPAHCDLDSNLNREVSTVNKIINKIDGEQLGSTRILHNFKGECLQLLNKLGNTNELY